MCLIFIALKQHPEYKFILAANRDEFYKRKTASADFWSDHNHIVGGRDLEAGGTWLAMNVDGKVSMVTNYRDPKNIDPDSPSRGHLVSDYLLHDVSAEKYLKDLEPRAELYNGFNLLLGNVDELFYLSNYKRGIDHLTHGVYGLSNHLLDTPWPKVVRGKERFSEILNSHVDTERLFKFLYDDHRAPDNVLPDTGIGLERERALSAMFIKSPGYGTRCSTVILVDKDDQVLFSERVYNTDSFHYTANAFNFQLSRS
jgi:uncharacterized protein with NRDE domain